MEGIQVDNMKSSNINLGNFTSDFLEVSATLCICSDLGAKLGNT